MKIFIDFDNTLLDTRRIVRELYIPLLETYGKTEDEIRKALGSFSSFAGYDHERGTTFTVERHLRLLGFTEEERQDIMPKAEVFFREAQRFLFPGVQELLAFLKDQETIVLTYGDKDFQLLKVKGAGILDQVTKVCCTEHTKVDEIKSELEAGERAVFIDDKAEYFPAMKDIFGERLTLIHFVPDTEGHSDMGCEADIHAKDYRSIINSIQKVCAES
jgi:FMN phosphatase YigB (HAD superfamily)